MTDQTPQEPTAAEQHQEDLARVQAQLGVTEATRVVSKVFSGIFGSSRGPGPHSRTSFENHELNAMVDLVEHSNPADLEEAGRALWQARDALKSASRELKHHVGEVQWKGTAGDEFRSFGEALVRHADNLAAFADVAGTQITVAGTGLASVQKSMPARDTRLNKQNVSEIALPKRVEGNPEYAAALKAEKNRQEAINQMNRLASFYAVSEERLAGQEAPRFDRALGAKVPPPAGNVWDPGGAPLGRRGSSSASPAAGPESGPSRVDPLTSAPQPQAVSTVPPPVQNRPDTSMQIDGVATPVAPPAATGGTPTPPVAAVPGQQTLPPPPVMNRVPPIQPAPQSGARGGGRPAAQGAPAMGGKGVAGAGVPPVAGRPGAVGGGPIAAGRAGVAGPAVPGTAGQQPTAGRTGMTGPVGGGGQGPMAGRASGTGPMGPMGQAPTAGRSGAAGQAISGRASTGPAGISRPGRPDGVVGGTPQRAASPGTSGTRIPLGTVVGGEGTPQGRASTGRPGQFGVVGANPVNGATSQGGRGTPSANGVVGTPRGNAPVPRSRTGEFTQGGAGLVRGPARRPQSDEEELDTGSPRPDYLTEDQQTWAVQRRGTVPPVVE
ncbi:hypothetical protein [Streptomyces sp. CAU 1734]|uniref:WXG100 family type VII secretion target n=1 Tax=Streptomyces sp. CAU 1734 TaxID=3140360 RepID=UPI003261052E